jgi:hypothetical protein
MSARSDANALCHAMDDVIRTAGYLSQMLWSAIAPKRHGKESAGKKLRNTLAVLLAVPLLCAHALRAQQGAASPAEQKITATWNFNYEPLPACGFSLLGRHSNCVAGFQFGEYVEGSCSNLKQVGNPSGAKGQVNGISTSLTVASGQADAIFCVAARYYNSSGTLLLGPMDLSKP